MACATALSLMPAAPSVAATPSRDAQLSQARAALARQDNSKAIRLLEQANGAFPDDAEILRLLGSAYAFDQRFPASILTLRRAQALAPQDLDVRAALARAYLWSGDLTAAAREVEALEQRAPGNADAAAIRQQLRADVPSGAVDRRRFGIAAAQGFSHVSFANRPGRTWSDTTVAIFGQLAPATALALAAEREDRRTAVDTRLELRLDQGLGPHVRTFVAFATTPHADFREKWGVTGGVEADVTSFATLLADLRHAEYRDASVTAFLPGLRLRARRLGLDATLRMINLWDEQGTHRSGVSGRIEQALAGGATLYAGAATYPDTEAGITRQVHSVFAGGTVPLSEKVTLRAGLDYDRRRATYRRKGASLGVQFRF